MKLWVDDVRTPPDGWVWAATIVQAQYYISTYLKDITDLSLDHDLGEWQGTGYTLVNWMERTGAWPTNKPTVHSMNPVGAERMRTVINRYYDKE